MQINVQAQAITGADGWVAHFSEGPDRPVLCWALVGDQLVGVAQTENGPMTKNATVGTVEGMSGFAFYQKLR